MNEATIRKNGNIETIDIDEMTKEFYNENEEHFFCPNPECDAKVVFASGPKRSYFSTRKYIRDGEEIIEQHNIDCPHFIERVEGTTARRRFDAEKLEGISEDHADNVLDKAFKRFLDPDYGKPKNKGKKKSKKRKVQKGEVDPSLPARGKLNTATPFDEEQERKPREEPVFYRDINDIGDSDYGVARAVTGEMISFNNNDGYISIELRTRTGKTARVYFGEYYQAHNDQQYAQIEYYGNYFRKRRKKNRTVVVSCLGEIRKDDYDISIVMNNYRHFRIDNLKHYAIVKKMDKNL